MVLAEVEEPLSRRPGMSLRVGDYETPELSKGNDFDRKTDKRRAAEELRPLEWIHRECLRLQNVFTKSMPFLLKSKPSDQ